jgi:hypothetical protein
MKTTAKRSAAALVCAALFAAPTALPARAAEPPAGTFDNAVLVGWDGVRRERLQEQLAAGNLPNLRRLIDAGGMTDTQVTTGSTQTKPGWAEILTGRSADGMGIESNDVYRPVPEGFTIFEALKKRLRGRVATIFIGGKDSNIGSRGPHEICVNCIHRMPPDYAQDEWWSREKISPITRTKCDLPVRWVRREGEPYFHTVKSLDLYKTAVGPADVVGAEALAALDRYRGGRFFAFIHFEDPDEQGHRHKESSPEYAEAIRTADRWLGLILDRLKADGVDGRTAVFVTTDHGFDPDERYHECAPDTFLATGVKRPLRAGDRKDVTPTILEALGVDPSDVRPPLEGRSLFVGEPKKP